ncbi:MAG: ornithine cyclodeaminase [Caldilineae bacterium]|nr:MAG: ornithine cyclodeaminase [Caldilineae bacterium]
MSAADRSVRFLYLTQEEVIACGGLDMEQTLAAVEKVFRLLDEGECIEPQAPIIHWNGIHRRRISMHPAYIGGDVQVAGIKWIPSNPENPIKRNMPRSNALTILSDPETGFPLAVMDGTAISAMRTGAVVGVGARYLAREDARVAGLIGAGVIQRTQLMALHAVLPSLERVQLYDMAPDKARAFAEEMGAQLGLDIEPVDSARAAVEGADVVAPATNVGPEDRYIRPEWIKEGAYLANVSVNDYTIAAVQACDRVVVDNRKQLTVPTAILTDMVEEGLIRPEEITELGAIITGREPGRRSPRERIFFSPLGMGIEDLINAHRVYLEARRRGIGRELELWHEPVWT